MYKNLFFNKKIMHKNYSMKMTFKSCKKYIRIKLWCKKKIQLWFHGHSIVIILHMATSNAGGVVHFVQIHSSTQNSTDILKWILKAICRNVNSRLLLSISYVNKFSTLCCENGNSKVSFFSQYFQVTRK